MNDDSDECWKTAFDFINSGRRDDAKAICEREPCASASIMCQKYLAWAYYGDDDFENALAWFSRVKRSGDAEGQYGVACVNFAQRDYLSALNNYKIALEQEYTRAYYWLGLIHEHGLGVERDIEKAWEYYSSGARCGYLVAKRAQMQTIFRHGTFMQKLMLIPEYISLLVSSFNIARNNMNDERLADVPIVATKCKRSKRRPKESGTIDH